MREIIFKDISSNNPRKKDIVLREMFEKDGVSTKTERRCFYFIKAIDHVEGEGDLQGWLVRQNKEGEINKRHFHILKEHNDKVGEDKVICKIAGTFYAVVNKQVYTIAFLHSFKARFSRAVKP